MDDNRDAADLTAELLTLHGHISAVAYGGAEAIQTSLTFIPDVVLLDLGMPVVDGFAVATAVRQAKALSHTMLIAYTAWNDASTHARTVAAGFDKHIAKPAKFDDILHEIASQ